MLSDNYPEEKEKGRPEKAGRDSDSRIWNQILWVAEASRNQYPFRRVRSAAWQSSPEGSSFLPFPSVGTEWMLKKKSKGKDKERTMTALRYCGGKGYCICVGKHSQRQRQGHLGESRMGITRTSCEEKGEEEGNPVQWPGGQLCWQDGLLFKIWVPFLFSFSFLSLFPFILLSCLFPSLHPSLPFFTMKQSCHISPKLLWIPSIHLALVSLVLEF